MMKDEHVASAARLPEDLEPYSRTATFTQDTVPAGLRKDHSTKAGLWRLIRVEQEVLRYRITDPRRWPTERELTPETKPGAVEPTIRHHVEPIGPVRFYVEFLREATILLRPYEELVDRENRGRFRR